MRKRFSEDQVLKVILSCFKGSAVTWHTTELSEVERGSLETANLDRWIKLLVRRFKEDTGEAVKLLYSEKFGEKQQDCHFELIRHFAGTWMPISIYISQL